MEKENKWFLPLPQNSIFCSLESIRNIKAIWGISGIFLIILTFLFQDLLCKKLFYRNQLFYSFFKWKAQTPFNFNNEITSTKENKKYWQHLITVYPCMGFSFPYVILLSPLFLLSVHNFHSSQTFSPLVFLFSSAHNLELSDSTKCWKLIQKMCLPLALKCYSESVFPNSLS